jgi:bifunctional UDP-N-acetylglucosamine pyrophosphorylase/glucosamine-1-phosphate N-acetyltransferase
MLTSDSLAALLDVHHKGNFSASVMTAEHPDPTGYGRIIRGADGSLLRIVEERDATDEERAIYEVNSGVYAFDGAKLAAAIGKLKNDNSQGELYLTDVLEILRNDGGSIAAVLIEDFIEILGVNDRSQLAESAALLRDQRGLIPLPQLIAMSRYCRVHGLRDPQQLRMGRSSDRAPHCLIAP